MPAIQVGNQYGLKMNILLKNLGGMVNPKLDVEEFKMKKLRYNLEVLNAS